MTGKRTFATNPFGVKVKRCCASCINKAFDDKGCRNCRHDNRVILNPQDCCSFWIMSESLSKAGLLRKDAPKLRDLTERIRALREHDKEMKELKKQLNRESQKKKREKMRIKYKK